MSAVLFQNKWQKQERKKFIKTAEKIVNKSFPFTIFYLSVFVSVSVFYFLLVRSSFVGMAASILDYSTRLLWSLKSGLDALSDKATYEALLDS